VYFNGAAAGPLDLAGAPLAIAPGPRGTFAALLDVRGKAHVVLIDASGIVGDGDVDANARQLAYDASAGNLVVLGAKGEGLGTLKGADSDASPDAARRDPGLRGPGRRAAALARDAVPR
jgi:hypothetical protein